MRNFHGLGLVFVLGPELKIISVYSWKNNCAKKNLAANTWSQVFKKCL